ncbi:hypothetical protein BBJ28_00018906 [Nothophytophthora sp. Chile5]|nr:hypothetical protein BBJ28_00018906 [Nothophytophthora sp. Chile5]
MRIVAQRRVGGWSKKQFFLTPTQWMYFDSMTSSEPSNSLDTIEIMAVQKSKSDAQQRVFVVVLFKKKKEYRAKSPEDRDAWVEALESVAGANQQTFVNENVAVGHGNDQPAAENHSVAEADSISNGSGSGSTSGVELRTLCDQMKKAFSWQLQISKSFSSKDVVEFVKKSLPHLSSSQIQEIGQGFIDSKLIIPLKSHVFDERDPGRFKFFEAVTPKQPKNHLNMRAHSIANLMGNEQFNARKYAEDFLRKHSPQKIDSHCKKLVAQKVKPE